MQAPRRLRGWQWSWGVELRGFGGGWEEQCTQRPQAHVPALHCGAEYSEVQSLSGLRPQDTRSSRHVASEPTLFNQFLTQEHRQQVEVTEWSGIKKSGRGGSGIQQREGQLQEGRGHSGWVTVLRVRKWAGPKGMRSGMQGRDCCPERKAEAEGVTPMWSGKWMPTTYWGRRRGGERPMLSGSPCLPHC